MNAARTSSIEEPSLAPCTAVAGGRVGSCGVAATIRGSMRITAYPATAPAPKPGMKILEGCRMIPSLTASAIAIGMLAADELRARAVTFASRGRLELVLDSVGSGQEMRTV